MAVAEWSDDEDRQSSAVPLDLFPVTPLIQGNDLSMLITDFFDWLETAWQLLLFQPDVVRCPLPLPLTLTEEQYTIPDLALVWVYVRLALPLCGTLSDRFTRIRSVPLSDWHKRTVSSLSERRPGPVP